MSATEGKSKVPVVDDKSDSFDRWEIQWNKFDDARGITDDLGVQLDTSMPMNNIHALDPTKDADKPIITASKANKRAMT
jgi:hypothetical protein